MIERHVPEPTPESQPFWDATRSGRLLLQWCVRCDRGIYYPRILCPGCGSAELEWRQSAGAGSVYAHATHESGSGERYCVALVDLAEGVRLLTNVVGVDPDDVAVGQLVELVWEPLADGRALALFRPAAGLAVTEPVAASPPEAKGSP